VVLDEVTEETRRERKLVGGVGVEEPMFVEESMEETGEELVVVGVGRFLGLTKRRNDLVDRDFLLVHALVESVALGFDLGRERGNGHARFRIGVLRREVHETRVKLEALRPNLLEELDVVTGEKLVTVIDITVISTFSSSLATDRERKKERTEPSKPS
jgi:hypothetical protein